MLTIQMFWPRTSLYPAITVAGELLDSKGFRQTFIKTAHNSGETGDCCVATALVVSHIGQKNWLDFFFLLPDQKHSMI